MLRVVKAAFRDLREMPTSAWAYAVHKFPITPDNSENLAIPRNQPVVVAHVKVQNHGNCCGRTNQRGRPAFNAIFVRSGRRAD